MRKKELVNEFGKDVYFIPGTQYTVEDAVKLINKTICNNACNIVFETNDYTMFEHFKENRKRRTWNLAKLKKSIEAYGYIANNPIIVTYQNGKLIILDGAHRFEILKEKIEKGQDCKIPFIIINTDDIVKTAQILNLAKSNWTPVDYISSFVERNTNYSNFKKYLWDNEDYKDIPFWSKVALLTKSYSNSGNGYSRKLAVNGLMTFTNDQIENVHLRAKRAQEVSYICKGLGVHTKLDKFVNAVVWLSEYGNGFNYQQFLSNLNSVGKELLEHDRSNFEKNMNVALKIHNKGNNQSKLRCTTFYKAFVESNEVIEARHKEVVDSYLAKEAAKQKQVA